MQHTSTSSPSVDAETVTVYELDRDGIPLLWTERDSTDRLWLCDSNYSTLIDSSDEAAEVAAWREATS